MGKIKELIISLFNRPSKRYFLDFMSNPDNEYRCDICPMRKTRRTHRSLPCGEQHCFIVSNRKFINKNL